MVQSKWHEFKSTFQRMANNFKKDDETVLLLLITLNTRLDTVHRN